MALSCSDSVRSSSFIITIISITYAGFFLNSSISTSLSCHVIKFQIIENNRNKINNNKIIIENLIEKQNKAKYNQNRMISM